MLLRFADFGRGCVDCWMRFRMRIISMGLDDGVVAIGQRAWRLGCFALTDVRYQLFFRAGLFL
jgi:hypothetical protein